MKLFTMFFVVVMFTSVEVAAEIYKCTSAGGEVDYTDRPCRGESSIFVPGPAPVVDEHVKAREEKRKRLLRAYREEDAAEKQKAAELKAERERRAEHCRRARINYRRIREAGRVFRPGSDGERVDFTDEERAAATARAQADVEAMVRREITAAN